MTNLKKAKAKVQANLERKERELAAMAEAHKRDREKSALGSLVNLILGGSKKSLA